MRGLLLDGERKSVEPLAARILEDARLHGPQVQALQQFVNQSPWPAETLLAGLTRCCETHLPADEVRYWVIDGTNFPRAGAHSVGVARQYCGALGKLSNCQVAVSLHVSDRALERSQPLSWELFLPDEWIEGRARRAKAGVPPLLAAQSKPALALTLIDHGSRGRAQRSRFACVSARVGGARLAPLAAARARRRDPARRVARG